MSQVLLYVSVGPVQGFIDQGRRLRDVWAGSFLLSWLTGHAISALLAAEWDDGRDARLLVPRVARPDLEQPPPGAPDPVDPMLRAVWQAGRGAPVSAPPLIGSLVNQFTALLEDDGSPDALFDRCRVVESAVLEAWEQVAGAVKTDLLAPALCRLEAEGWSEEEIRRVKELWSRQTGAGTSTPFFEVYWVTEPVPDGTDPYQVLGASDALERRKLWRKGGPPDHPFDRCHLIAGWPEVSGFVRSGGRRSREAQDRFWRTLAGVVHEHVYGTAPPDAGWPGLEIARDERLSAVALVKRLFPVLKEQALRDAIGWVPKATAALTDDAAARELRIWPSTAYMAAVHWLIEAHRVDPGACRTYGGAVWPTLHRVFQIPERMTSRKLQAVADAVVGDQPAATFFGLDGPLFFSRGLERSYRRPDPEADDPPDDKKTRRDAYQALIHALEAKVPGLREPSPYYALLVMDGDRLGEKFGQAALPADGVARALLAFSRAAPAQVARCRGLTLFAGGDEIFAVLPIETAIRAAIALRRTFIGAIRRQFPGLQGIERVFTVSAGIVFADYQLPLAAARREAVRLVEEVAKERNGRDSLAVAVMNAPTPSLTWVSAWRRRDGVAPAAELLWSAARLARDRELSARWLHRLQSRFGLLFQGGHAGSPDDLIELEAFEQIMRSEHHRDRTRLPGDSVDRLFRGLSLACLVARGQPRPFHTLEAPPGPAPAPPPGLLGKLKVWVGWSGPEPDPPQATAPTSSAIPSAGLAAENVVDLGGLWLVHFLAQKGHWRRPSTERAAAAPVRSGHA